MILRQGNLALPEETTCLSEQCWKNLEHRRCSPLSSQSEEGVQEGGEEFNRWTPGSTPGAIHKVLASMMYLWEAGSVGSWWDSPDQVEQEALHQQTGQSYKDCFKLNLVGEGDGVLSNREEPGAADAWGTNRETPVK